MLKQYLLLLAVLLSVLFPLYSLENQEEEMVEISMNDLTKLETTLTNQLQQIQMLKDEQKNSMIQLENSKKQLTNLQTQLSLLDQSLMISNQALKSVSTSFNELNKMQRNDKWKLGFEVCGITLAVAVPVGICLGLFVIK